MVSVSCLVSRIQILSGEFAELLVKHSPRDFGTLLGHMFGVAMTTLLSVPTSLQLSLAMTTLFYTYPDPAWRGAQGNAYAEVPVWTAGGGATAELGDGAPFTVLLSEFKRAPAESAFVLDVHPRYVARRWWYYVAVVRAVLEMESGWEA